MSQLFMQAEKVQDSREGKNHVAANIEICNRIAEFMETTLGPYGMDKMFAGKDLVITNDGATILKEMNIVNPAGKVLAALSESQDNEVGDGTTSVVLLTAEILNSLKTLILDNFSYDIIFDCLKELQEICLEDIKKLKVDFSDEVLHKLAETCVTSKNIRNERGHFARMIVEALKGTNLEDASSVGIKKIHGGSISDSKLVDGVAFEKCFTYAGYEQQPKKICNPKVLCLNVELEWKSERENAEFRITNVEEYQKVANAEWEIITMKLREIVDSGANVVLSSLPVGDYATQYFAKHNIFCAGRVAKEDLKRISQCFGGTILSSTDYLEDCLGSCSLFEERQLGKLRYNYFEGKGKNVKTMILRGPGSELLEEIGRSVHDGMCVVRTALKHKQVVTGGGSVEMELSKSIRNKAIEYKNKKMFVAKAVSQAFERIPMLLAKNFGLDTIRAIQELRREHQNDKTHAGVGLRRVEDMMDTGVYEPLEVKENMIKAAFNAVRTIIMIDSTIMVPKKQ